MTATKSLETCIANLIAAGTGPKANTSYDERQSDRFHDCALRELRALVRANVRNTLRRAHRQHNETRLHRGEGGAPASRSDHTWHDCRVGIADASKNAPPPRSAQPQAGTAP